MDPMRVIPNPVPTSYNPASDTVPVVVQAVVDPTAAAPLNVYQDDPVVPVVPVPVPVAQHTNPVIDGSGIGGVAHGHLGIVGGGVMAPNPMMMGGGGGGGGGTVVPVDLGVIGETPTQMYQTSAVSRKKAPRPPKSPPPPKKDPEAPLLVTEAMDVQLVGGEY